MCYISNLHSNYISYTKMKILTAIVSLDRLCVVENITEIFRLYTLRHLQQEINHVGVYGYMTVNDLLN